MTNWLCLIWERAFQLCQIIHFLIVSWVFILFCFMVVHTCSQKHPKWHIKFIIFTLQLNISISKQPSLLWLYLCWCHHDWLIHPSQKPRHHSWCSPYSWSPIINHFQEMLLLKISRSFFPLTLSLFFFYSLPFLLVFCPFSGPDPSHHQRFINSVLILKLSWLKCVHTKPLSSR